MSNNNGEQFSGSAAGWAMIIFLIVLVLAVLYKAMTLAGFDPFAFWRAL